MLAEEIAAALSAEIAGRTEWDEPPALYFLYVEDGAVTLRRQPYPDEWWSRGRPPEVLEAMSQIIEAHFGPLSAALPESLYAVAFFCETWLVQEPPPGTAERSELESDAWAHRIHTRPDRVETRSMWAVDRNGTRYQVVLRRDIDTEPQKVTGSRGDIPESLNRMVRSLTPGAGSVV